jgi:predicted nucleotidyltransferase
MTIQQAQAVLASHPDIRLAYVFGSMALSRARQDSDLDIAMQAKRPIDSAIRVQLIEELDPTACWRSGDMRGCSDRCPQTRHAAVPSGT